LLGRAGQASRVRQEARSLSEQDSSGPVCYSIACAYALVSPGDSDALESAFMFLERALEQGYGKDKIESDPDLAPIRSDVPFDRLLHGGEYSVGSSRTRRPQDACIRPSSCRARCIQLRLLRVRGTVRTLAAPKPAMTPRVRLCGPTATSAAFSAP